MPPRQDTHQIELLDAQDFAEYVLTDPLEIAAVMNGLVQQRTMMSAYPEGSRDFLLTTLLAHDKDGHRLILDPPADDDGKARALAAPMLTFSALLDKIKIQFSSGPAAAIEFQGYPAFSVPPPEQLLRLQRREYYRLITPVAHAIVCQIPVRAEDGTVRSFEARVLDISGGGLGVMVPPRDLALSTNMEFEECTLVLPEFGAVTSPLRIRNVFQVTNRNGITMMRAGCQFVDLPPGAEATIQRYILKIERERGARIRGA